METFLLTVANVETYFIIKALASVIDVPLRTITLKVHDYLIGTDNLLETSFPV